MTSGFNSANLLPVDGEVYLLSQSFSAAESASLYTALLTGIAWRQEPIKIFGRQVMQPRLTAWYGDEGTAYSYSGITMQPLGWTDELNFIRDRIRSLSGHSFNSALLNLYRNGEDSMGWHQDNEASLGRNPVIASVSFGATRMFQLRHLSGGEMVKVPLTDGSLLLMAGATQHHWRHAIPKEQKITTGRINITFRNVVGL